MDMGRRRRMAEELRLRVSDRLDSVLSCSIITGYQSVVVSVCCGFVFTDTRTKGHEGGDLH